MDIEKAEQYIRTMLKDKDIPDGVKTISYVYAKEAIETVLAELENKQDDINILQAQRDSMEYQFKQAKAELEKKDKEIEKLKKDNKELLRKLRNRVKEVNKLTKYSLYKKEFSTLNKQLQNKDKVINEMAKTINKEYYKDIIENYTKKVEKEGIKE